MRTTGVLKCATTPSGCNGGRMSMPDKSVYQSPETMVVYLEIKGRILNGSNNGEMGNGGFLDE